MVASIDTVLADQYKSQIIEAGIPSYMFDTKDGKFSCYIDAVAKKIGPSSYCSPDQMIDLTDINIKDVFSTF